MVDTGFAEKALVGHAEDVLGLPFGLCFFLLRALAGGDADDGPNVKERENEDAKTEPIPEPPRDCDCWSGEVAIEVLWLANFLSAAMGPGRKAVGGVVPVEYGGVEESRPFSLDERPEPEGKWLSLGVEPTGVTACDLLGTVVLSE